MTKGKQTFKLLLRLTLTFFAMLVAYILSTIVIGQNNTMLTPEEASQAGRGLFLVSLMASLVLSYIILNSTWHGLKLTAAISVIHFGTETCLAQLETLYYNTAVQMSTAEFISLVVAGALRALIFSPFAVLILGKMKKPAQINVNGVYQSLSYWLKRLAAMAGFYMFVYFLFGYIVAWQWAETRLYYTGTADIKPFFRHFLDLFLIDDPCALPFQLLRGTLWALLAVMIVKMTNVKRWQAALTAALVFVVFLALPLGVFPNPYLPPVVARSHFYEIASSMLLFGVTAGWVFHPGKSIFPTRVEGYGQLYEA